MPKAGFRKISEEAVKKRTGRTTKQWNKILDNFNVKKNGHTLAAKSIKDKYSLSP